MIVEGSGEVDVGAGGGGRGKRNGAETCHMHKDYRANFATVIAADKQTRSVVGKQARPSHLGLV